MEKLAWHFDFHSSKEVRIGHDPDVEGTADALAEAEVEEIITFAKCHTGFSYYPTEVGIRHPLMKGDPFGDLLKACRAKGVKVLAYVSFGVDGEAVRAHDDWARHYAPGKTTRTEDHYGCTCPFTPYVDDYFLPQVQELLERYEPDGFFFDTMAAFNLCYCDVCRAEFEAQAGTEIPVEESDTGWAEYGQFRHDRALAVIDRVGRFIQAIKPGTVVGFNQVGSPPQPEAMPAGINRITLDFATYGAQSRQASLSANYGSTASLPADIMPTRYNEGWGDWTSAPASSLEHVAAPVFAFGERLYMGDRLHPANRITAGTRKALKTVSQLHADLGGQLPDHEVPRATDAVILHTREAVYGPAMESFALNARHHLTPLSGAHRLFMDAGWNFAIVGEPYLDAWLDTSRLLIIPELPALSPATSDRINGFLREGGQTLTIGDVPTVNGAPAPWLGISEGEERWQDHIYLPFPHDDEPVMVRGAVSKAITGTARAVLQAIAPYDLRYGIRMGWNYNPPADTPADSPILTCNTVGQGQAWHLMCPICTDYMDGINFQQKRWTTYLLNEVMGLAPKQLLDSEFGNVELIPYANEKESWSVILNHGGEELSCRDGSLGKGWPRTVGPLPPYPITVKIAAEGREPRSVTCNGAPCDSSLMDGALQVALTMDTLWKVIHVTW